MSARSSTDSDKERLKMPPAAGPGHPDRLRIENMRAMCMLADENRLAALHRYGILDTPVEADFDNLTKLAAAICEAPMSIINFVDDNRQWFKAATGMNAREAPLDTAICTHAMLQSDLFIIPDTLKDDRFAENPLCAGMDNLRFYAGALLRSPDGYTLGTVCVLDHEPRNLNEAQKQLLRTIAQQVINMLELRRQAEIHRQIGAKLDAELSVRKEILGVVTHDLRSPLNSVNLVAHLLDDIQTEPNEDDLTPAEMGRMLRDCVGDMQRLVADLSDFSVVEQGGLTMTLGKCDPRSILAGAERRFHLPTERAGIQLKIDAADNLPKTIIADEQRITQAIGNLLFNAVKFTSTGGRITVSCKVEDSKVIFSVADTGCGIPEHKLPHVFERFWTDGDAKHGGRGIGLTIAQGIARAHGGDISVTSQVNKGTTFSMNLPL